MPEDTTHTATGYLVLEAARSGWRKGYDGLGMIDHIKVAAYRANRPSKLERDQIAVKVAITIDDAEFSPITATLALTLDPSRVIHPVVEDLEPGE
ncbi:hypothetical protein [Mycobacteroides abscessus]|uniref:Uncharacterized protein n=1 Tax=Mycobacteroides abscessus subsp. massiliense TaxID=1962118 RepID=A0A1U0SUN8_9MYCO|nr:hypothetical protein [Mycobacteroides abscessus]SII37082.1 Uncharacterised protein [Mycobacteroides abscessus subsp. abscessus]SII48674.1 Uncharacterised protein [Mycobacteroides abscessus subsp. abscessus]SII89734.1 Uncharacterised protein [Mycobacteroides abscessus subsp. abscessus]SKL51260.1 Uncharacterised protein [Mycobacteroides abscessus subsp. massiliense]SKS70910.1 Uncharacterised protein [Mycobacteroides abscessus subsp. massiliense]